MVSDAPKAKVLLVDDDAQIRSTFARVLQSTGFDVKTAETGKAALALLGGGDQIDVILTDLIMPGMDGLTFLRAVRLLDLDVPVVVITGSPTIESAVSTVEHGGYRYLMKPVSLDELTSVVGSAGNAGQMNYAAAKAGVVCN